LPGGLDRFDPVAGAGLADRRGQVVPHGALGQEQPSGDVRDGGAAVGGGQHVAFPVGERVRTSGQRGGGQGRVDQLPAPVHLADGVGQLLNRAVLDQEATSACLHGAAQVTGPGERGEDQHPAGRQFLAQVGRDIKTAAAGHLDVEQRHVRRGLPRDGQYLVTGFRLRDHLDVRFQAEQQGERAAHHSLVFG
jgi:hypothetical protein